MQKEAIIQKLKERGCRITKQRLMLLDIIMEEDYSCCKEIYYKHPDWMTRSVRRPSTAW